MKEIKLILLAVMICCMSSCGTINNIVGQPAATSTKEKKENSGSNRAMRHFFSKKNKTQKPDTVSVNSVAQQQVDKETGRPDVAAADNGMVNRASAVNRALADHLAGEWKFDNVFGRSVVGEDDRPYIIFEADGKYRFYAFDGCNYTNGRYSVIDSNELVMTDLLTTGKLCPGNSQASEIAAVMSQGKYFELTTLRAEEYLEILNDSRQRIGTLHRHCIAAINGMWEVAAIGKDRVDGAEPPTIVIDLLERRIHGNSGCNLFNGTIYQDPDKDVSVQFQGMKVTKRGCKKVSVETALLVALERVEMVLIDDDTHAVLCDGAGNHLITLVRTE